MNVVLTAIALGVTILGQVAESKVVIRVGVQVGATEDRIADLMTSYITSELRSLNDVRVSTRETDEANYKLVVRGLDVVFGSQTTGYAISVIALAPIDAPAEMYRTPPPKKALVFMYDELRICSFDSLRRHCSEIVAGFDQSVLEPFRQLYDNELKKSNEEAP